MACVISPTTIPKSLWENGDYHDIIAQLLYNNMGRGWASEKPEFWVGLIQPVKSLSPIKYNKKKFPFWKEKNKRKLSLNKAFMPRIPIAPQR